MPRQKAMLEDEFERLLNHHSSGGGSAACDCSHPTGTGGAPLYCHLGLPRTDEVGAGSGAAREADADTEHQQQQQQQEGGEQAQAAAAQQAGEQQQQQQQQQQQGQHAGEPQHRLAVLIPYRDRLPHLTTLLVALRPYLERQGRPHDVFVLEQVSWSGQCLLPLLELSQTVPVATV